MNGHGKEASSHILSGCVKKVSIQMISLFACLLSACSHVGLVDESMPCYASKITDYMNSAKVEHYTCIINLGHPGHLHDAENIIKPIPCRPNVAAWMVLLRIHGTVEMGEHVAKWVLNRSLKML
jgi:hypothetical protein